MEFTKEKQDEFREACIPLMDWLAENFNVAIKATVTPFDAILAEQYVKVEYWGDDSSQGETSSEEK